MGAKALENKMKERFIEQIFHAADGRTNVNFKSFMYFSAICTVDCESICVCLQWKTKLGTNVSNVCRTTLNDL